MSSTSNDIADSVCRALDTYFRDLDGENPTPSTRWLSKRRTPDA